MTKKKKKKKKRKKKNHLISFLLSFFSANNFSKSIEIQNNLKNQALASKINNKTRKKINRDFAYNTSNTTSTEKLSNFS